MTKDRKTVLLLGDILALALGFATMVAIRFSGAYSEFIGVQARLFFLLFILWLVIFFIFDLYNLRRVNPNPRNIGTLAIAIATCTLISGILFYLFPIGGITPKTNLAIVAVGAFIFLVLWRRLFYRLFASRYVQHIAVIGSGPAVDHLLLDLKNNPHIGTVVSIHPTFDASTTLPRVHLVIADNVNLQGLMNITEQTGAEVLSLSGAYEELFGKIPLSLMTEERAIGIITKQHQVAYRLVGRVAECIIATLILIVSLPFLLLAIIAILIEDGGPVIYRQERVGKLGKVFTILKLRNMVKNAEAHGAQWAVKNDPRSTNVGRVLRKLHIDEIPQMINILRGDIALIGPRPERPEFVSQLEKQIPYYFLRHSSKPGFTGWAQIKFRYARTILDSQEKFEYDLYYLAKKNPLFDLGILLKTIQIIFTH